MMSKRFSLFAVQPYGYWRQSACISMAAAQLLEWAGVHVTYCWRHLYRLEV